MLTTFLFLLTIHGSSTLLNSGPSLGPGKDPTVKPSTRVNCRQYYANIIGDAPTVLPRDCDQVRDIGGGVDGIYMIFPDAASTGNCNPILVYCDQTKDGGGWTVIQRRITGRTDFLRGWEEYKNGFGFLWGEHWLGNDAIHRITMQGEYEIYIMLRDFQFQEENAQFFPFSISSEETNYTLGVGPYFGGNAGDSLSGHNGQQFTTIDRDNDPWAGNCATEYTGAWWYKSCHTSNLNGQYLRGPNSAYAQGVVWSSWQGFSYSLYATEMKIKLRRGPFY